MFDLKVIKSVLEQLEQERGIPQEKMLEAIEAALASAYKKEYGKKGQIVRAKFDIETGKTEFFQVKVVVDETKIILPDENGEFPERADDDERLFYNAEHHIMMSDANMIKKDAELDDEIIFPLEEKADYGRIAAQTAKQIIIQKIREAEKVSVMSEFGQREGEIVSGTVQRIERGSIYIDLGRATGLLSYEEQIPGERYKQGERIRAYLYKVEESPRGILLRVSRSHPKFLYELFKIEAPEIASGAVEIKSIAREAGSRSKVAVLSNDSHLDPVGSLVGQRGVRVSTVMSELAGEKIDIIEWSEDPAKFVEDSLSPAKVISVAIDAEDKKAIVEVSEDQQSLAIGKGGQNVRLAAKLTGWKIDIKSAEGEKLVESDELIDVAEVEKEEVVVKTEETTEEKEEIVKTEDPEATQEDEKKI